MKTDLKVYYLKKVCLFYVHFINLTVFVFEQLSLSYLKPTFIIQSGLMSSLSLTYTDIRPQGGPKQLQKKKKRFDHFQTTVQAFGRELKTNNYWYLLSSTLTKNSVWTHNSNNQVEVTC